METLSAAIEFRDCSSEVHVRRVREVTRLLLEDVMEFWPEYGLDQEQVKQISDLSVMHDIGKAAVPDALLNKNGRLTGE